MTSRITWTERRDGSGRTFAGTHVGPVRVEVYPGLMGGEWWAAVLVGRHRWTTNTATDKQARRVGVALARALAAERR